jgi:hypothetical protein
MVTSIRFVVDESVVAHAGAKIPREAVLWQNRTQQKYCAMEGYSGEQILAQIPILDRGVVLVVGLLGMFRPLDHRERKNF